MATLTVNTHNEHEKEVLIAFLESLRYDYRFEDKTEWSLTKAQEHEILRRDRSFTSGNTTTRSWDEVKKDLGHV